MKTHLQPTLPGMSTVSSPVRDRGGAVAADAGSIRRTFPPGAACVTIAGKWQMLPDGAVAAQGTADEWTIADRVAAAIAE